MRPSPPAPFNLDEHRELALEIRAANARMQELYKVMVDVYGPNNQAVFTFQKIVEGLDHLCRDLQAQADQDLPGHHLDKLYL